MLIDIQIRNLDEARAIRAHAQRRVLFALSRLAHRIQRVTLTLDDLNGPRGGVDKTCRVRVQLRGASDVIVDERHTDVHALLDLALSRAGRAVGRHVTRSQGAALGGRERDGRSLRALASANAGTLTA